MLRDRLFLLGRTFTLPVPSPTARYPARAPVTAAGGRYDPGLTCMTTVCSSMRGT